MGRKQMLKRIYNNEGDLISKECTHCHKIKPASEFNKDKNKIDGLRLKCKECLKKYRQDNAESIKKYQKQYQKQYQRDNTERIREREKQYRKNNAERIREHKKQYRNKQIEESLQQIKEEIEKEPKKYNYAKDKDVYGIIYLVHNIKSNRYYVGQTTIGFGNRYPSGWLYYHRNKELIKEDLQLYGENSFKYTKLFKVAHSQYELDRLEAYYIDYYDSYENGYNENRGNIFTDRGKEK